MTDDAQRDIEAADRHAPHPADDPNRYYRGGFADGCAHARTELAVVAARARADAFTWAAGLAESFENAALTSANRAAAGTFAHKSALATADAMSALGSKLESLAAHPSPAEPARTAADERADVVEWLGGGLRNNDNATWYAERIRKGEHVGAAERERARKAGA